jgi:hypothetical protein
MARNSIAHRQRRDMPESPSDPSSLLPYELWRYILRLATNPPAVSIYSTWPLPPDSPTLRSWGPNPSTYAAGHTECYNTKKSVALVSKFWRDLTTDFFYEDILLLKYGDLELFARSLQKSELHDPTFSRAHGFHVKAVLLQFRLSDFMLQKSMETHIMTICRLCDNLKVLSIPSFHFGMEDTMSPRLAQTLSNCCSSLLFLGMGEWYASIEFFKNIECFRNIQTLYISPRGGGEEAPDLQAAIPNLSFPNLHTLLLGTFHGLEGDEFSNWVTSWHLPNLINLSVEPDFREDLAASSFFIIHGPKLLSIMVGRLSTKGESPIKAILPKCPFLQRLQILNSLNLFETPFRGLPLDRNSEITFLLNPQNSHSQAPSLYVNQSLMRVLNVDSHVLEMMGNPAIESVKLSSFRNSDFLDMKWKKRQTVFRWRKWLDDWGREGVRLEDANGDVLRIPSEAWERLEK